MVVVASTVWRVVFSCQLLLFTICFFFFGSTLLLFVKFR